MFLFGFFESDNDASVWASIVNSEKVSETWATTSWSVVGTWSSLEVAPTVIWAPEVQKIEVVEQVQKIEWSELVMSWLWDFWILFAIIWSLIISISIKKLS